MAFGNEGTRSIAPINNDFEKMAQAYTKEAVIEEIKPKKEEVREEVKGEFKKEVEDELNNSPSKEEKSQKELKPGPKKKVKKEKDTKAYYKQFYNLRVDLPKKAEELVELGAKIYGSKKNYISKLIREDMQLHANEYREKIKEQPEDEWDF